MPPVRGARNVAGKDRACANEGVHAHGGRGDPVQGDAKAEAEQSADL